MRSVEALHDLTDLEDAIERFVASRGSTLRGKAFDVTNRDGRRDYAEWLAHEIMSLETFLVDEGQS